MGKSTGVDDSNAAFRQANAGLSPMQILVRDVHSRCAFGPVLIVVERPAIFLSVFRKQWMKYGRQLQVERARTFKPEKLQATLAGVATIYQTTFSASKKLPEVDVLFIAPETKANIESLFATMYFCSQSPHKKELITLLAPDGKLGDYTISAAALNPQ